MAYFYVDDVVYFLLLVVWTLIFWGSFGVVVGIEEVGVLCHINLLSKHPNILKAIRVIKHIE